MSDRIQKINFALGSIPIYNGDINKLTNFINSVDLIQKIFATINPPLDSFETAIIFLNIKSKITDKALDSIKDIEFNDWSKLRSHLTETFKDKSNAVTTLNDLLKIQNVKNPYKLLELTKNKFLNFKSRLGIEEKDSVKKSAIIDFTEKLIVNNFISSISDPYRNNLATRNPQNINDIEILLQNDFQYLKPNINFNSNIKPVTRQLTNIPPQRFPGTSFPTGPINFQKENPIRKTFAPRQQVKNAQFMKPTPMSTQTRQTFQSRQQYPKPNNYFTQQNRQFGTHQPNYITEEINNTELFNEDFPLDNENPNENPNEYLDENLELEYPSQENFIPEQNPFLEICPDVQEKS